MKNQVDVKSPGVCLENLEKSLWNHRETPGKSLGDCFEITGKRLEIPEIIY